MKTELDKLNIIKSFIYMNKGLFTKIKETRDIIFAYCNENTDTWWNFAFLRNPVGEKGLQEIEDFFKNGGKSSTIYLIDDKKFSKMSELLLGRKYKPFSTDYWMFWNNEIPKVDGENILEVKSDEDFERWIDTFIKSYPKDDPKNPYGEQVEFSKVFRKVWYGGKTKEDKYFLVFDNKEPVAVGILTSYNKMGYISAIGSIPSARGKGFGKKISLYCVQQSFKRGNKVHFLATEKGHFPFEFYTKIGFEPKFTATYYVKENKI